MELEEVPLVDIVPNPWRDLELYPIDRDRVRVLRESIDDHGFWGGVPGRRRNGKVELGFGHMRIEAARQAGLTLVPIFIGVFDDDSMLRLMVMKNAMQPDARPGDLMNEVAAVTRRLVVGLTDGAIVPPAVKLAFVDEEAVAQAVGRLFARMDVHIALGHETIRRYLGRGDPQRSPRGSQQIQETITALRQCGRYDDIIDAMLDRYPRPAASD